MLGVLLVVLTVLLIVLVWQIRTLVNLERHNARFAVDLMKPRNSSALDAYDEFEEDLPRNIVQQMADVMGGIERRLDNIEGALAYIRSYIWEEQDTRFLRDIKDPPQSRWGRMSNGASLGDASQFGLWKRERDWDEEWHRDVVAPSGPKRNGEAAADKQEPRESA